MDIFKKKEKKFIKIQVHFPGLKPVSVQTEQALSRTTL